MKNLSDETLKRLWASEWPAGDIKFGIYLDEVFTELTSRGYAV